MGITLKFLSMHKKNKNRSLLSKSIRDKLFRSKGESEYFLFIRVEFSLV